MTAHTIRTGSEALLVYPEGDTDTVVVEAIDHAAAYVRVPSGRLLAVCHEDLGLGVDDDLAFVLDDGCTTFDHLPPTSPADTRESTYKAGWDASRRTTTCDLDAAEARYERRHVDVDNLFSAGWADYSADRPYGWSLTSRQLDGTQPDPEVIADLAGRMGTDPDVTALYDRLGWAEPCGHCGHADDHIDRRDGCDSCNDAAQVGTYAPCAAPTLAPVSAPPAPTSWVDSPILAAGNPFGGGVVLGLRVDSGDERHVLVLRTELPSLHPFVVWTLDREASRFSGSYHWDIESATAELIRRGAR